MYELTQYIQYKKKLPLVAVVLTYVMNILLEMLSRCPRYLSQGPAELMWSVVHFW